MPEALVSVELGRHLAATSYAIGRQVGVLIDRRGHVTHVFVGEAQRIYLPDIGRIRAGAGNRRGLRHVHTVLAEAQLTRDDRTDLHKLRLDAVAVLGLGPNGQPGDLAYAFLQLNRTEPQAPQSALERLRAAATVPQQQTGFGIVEGYARSLHELDVDVPAKLLELGDKEAPQALGKITQGQVPAMLVGVYNERRGATARMTELRELAKTAGLGVVEEVVQLKRVVDSKFVLGRGKLEECVLACLDTGCDLLVIDHDLTPAQARAIAALSDLRVIDRTQLILDIFAQHAKTRDGKLQVELAQLKYTLPRLTDLDAGLSRLSGGIGGRGPGETKLELGRRRARDRIARLEKDIAQLQSQRDLRRQRRSHSGLPVVSIIGYTNAGKSTLMGRLTDQTVKGADKLFATLDTTSRKLHLDEEHDAILTDTVGFIRDLPPALMRAFRATLEELDQADLLLHVVDVGDEDRDEKMRCVGDLLEQMDLAGLPCLVVLNKVDTSEPYVWQALAERLNAVGICAHSGEHMGKLREAIVNRLNTQQPAANLVHVG